MGQAHPPAGLLMKSDNPYIFTHSAIFTGIVNSSLSRLLSLSLAHTGHPVMLTQVRRTCLLFAYSSPVNRVLSYHISLHVSQFTHKLAGDKMKACLSNGRICVSCQLEHTHTPLSLFWKHRSGPDPGLFSEGRGLSRSQQPITLLSAGS